MNDENKNYVVVDFSTNKMEALFSKESDAVDFSKSLYESDFKQTSFVSIVDDETLGRYLINDRTDDSLLKQEIIFSTNDLRKVYENISKTEPFEGFANIVKDLSKEFKETDLNEVDSPNEQKDSKVKKNR